MPKAPDYTVLDTSGFDQPPKPTTPSRPAPSSQDELAPDRRVIPSGHNIVRQKPRRYPHSRTFRMRNPEHVFLTTVLEQEEVPSGALMIRLIEAYLLLEETPSAYRELYEQLCSDFQD